MYAKEKSLEELTDAFREYRKTESEMLHMDLTRREIIAQILCLEDPAVMETLWHFVDAAVRRTHAE